MLKKLISELGIYTIAPFIPKLASILILPLITPYLTKEDYGVFGIILAFAYFMEIFFTLALSVNLGNSFYQSKGQYKWYWRQLYGFWVLWSLPYSIILGAVLYLVIPQEAVSNLGTIILLLTIPKIIFGSSSEIAKSYFHLNKQPLHIGLRSAIFGVLSLVLTLYFIKYMKMGYMGWFWSMFIVSILTNISWFYALRFQARLKPIYNFKKKTIMHSLKVGVPLIPHVNAMYILSYSDRMVMKFLNVSSGNIGIYNASYTIGNIFETLNNSVNQTLVPYIYQMIRNKQEIAMRDLFFALQIGYFFSFLFVALFAQELVDFLFQNPDFKDIYHLVVLIIVGMMFKPMYIASTLPFFYFEKTKRMSFFSIGAGLINVVLNIILIPLFGFEMAAVTTIIGFLFLSFSRFYSKEYKEISTLDYYPTFWLFLSIIFCVISYGVTFLPFSTRFIISLFLLVFSAISIYYKKDKLKSIFTAMNNIY